MMQMPLQQGLFAGQQATQLEAMGNVAGAAECYDQAAQVLGTAIAQAEMTGMPIGDQVFNWAAQAQFGCARTKSAMGLLPMAMMHLQQALFAANQAVMRNPGFAPNHALAGMILAAMGNVPEAMRALGQATMLNPADQVSRAMLAQLGAMMPVAAPAMGPVGPSPMQGAAMQAAPMPGVAMPGMTAAGFYAQPPMAGVPPAAVVPQAAQAPASPDGTATHRMETIGTFLDLTVKVMKTWQQADQTFHFNM